MTGWSAGLGPAQASVQCGGAAHRLRWEDGELRALDHDDAAGERALAALGGQRCACIDVLDAWDRRAGDARVLTLASRGPQDQLPVSAAGPQLGPGATVIMAGWNAAYATHAVPAGFGSYPAGPSTPGEDLSTLLGLGGGLPDRLLANVIAVWRRRLEDPGDEACAQALPQLQATLYGRATAALRAWLDRPDLDVALRMIDAGSQARLTEEDGANGGGGRVRAELPFAWLETVWTRGLATIMGRFCLDARASGDGREWTLSTIGRDLGEPGPAPEPVTIRLPA